MMRNTNASFNPVDLAVRGIAGLTPYKPGKPIEALEREYGVNNIIKLASNENPLGPSPAATAAMKSAEGEIYRYPDGNGFELKQALAGHLQVNADQITLGNGSNEILELLARTFVSPDDEVLFSQHAFAVYPIVTQAVGATAVTAPARNYGHDLDAMARRITDRTRLIFIANPNNPTGTWLTANDLKRFLDQTPQTAVVAVDEAYFEYVEEPEYASALDFLSEYPNLVITRTFSKIYGLAGLRMGYGVSSPAIADLLNRARQPFNTNLLAQAAAIAALGDAGFVAKSRETNRAGYGWLVGQLEKLGVFVIPGVGNFVSFRVDDAMDVYEALLRQGVIIRPIEDYDLPGFLRVTIGSGEENARFIDALSRTLNQSQARTQA